MAKIKGIWKFNDIISLINIVQNVNFSCGAYSVQTKIQIINIDGDNRIMIVPGYYNVYRTEEGWISDQYRIFDFGESEQEVSDEFAIWLFQNANGGRIIFPESDINTKVLIKENGVTTLATANTYCETDIDLDVNIEDKSEEAYEAGRQAEYDAFWDSFQDYGKRTDYSGMFSGAGWNKDTFKPKYDIIPTQMQDGVFSRSALVELDLAEILASLGRKLDTSNCTSFYRMCSYSGPSHFPEINAVSCNDFRNMFYHTLCLKAIDKIILRENGDQNISAMFVNCGQLNSIIFEGVIGTASIDLGLSPLLSKNSVISIVNALSSSTTGLTVTLSLTAINNAFETSAGAADGSTSEEWLSLVATKPNWTISLI